MIFQYKLELSISYCPSNADQLSLSLSLSIVGQRSVSAGPILTILPIPVAQPILTNYIQIPLTIHYEISPLTLVTVNYSHFQVSIINIIKVSYYSDYSPTLTKSHFFNYYLLSLFSTLIYLTIIYHHYQSTSYYHYYQPFIFLPTLPVLGDLRLWRLPHGRPPDLARPRVGLRRRRTRRGRGLDPQLSWCGASARGKGRVI